MNILHLELIPPFLWYDELNFSSPYSSSYHTHPAWQLTFSLEGVFRFGCQGEILTVMPGEWILFSPALSHSAGSDSSSSRAIQIFFTNFPIPLLPEFAQRLNFRRSFRLTGSWDPARGRELAAAFQGIACGRSHAPSAMKNIYSLQFVSEALEAKIADLPSLKELPGELIKVLTFMEQNLSSAVGVPDFAALLGLSESRFSAVFRKMTGVSPMHYFNELRLSQAQRLLLAGESVKETALKTGFGSVSFFCRKFKLYTGKTPGAFVEEQI